MLPFAIYLIAGAVTGFHVYTLLSLAVYGAPFNPLEFVSLLGSFGLLIAAYVSLFRPIAGARIALIAALTVWCFYGPAVARSLRSRHGTRTKISQGFSRPTAPAFELG